MQNKVTVTVRGCTVEVYPDDGGVTAYESGRDHEDDSERYESAFWCDDTGATYPQGYVGNVADDDELLALSEALREAIAQARTRWPEVDAVFAAQDRGQAQG